MTEFTIIREPNTERWFVRAPRPLRWNHIVTIARALYSEWKRQRRSAP